MLALRRKCPLTFRNCSPLLLSTHVRSTCLNLQKNSISTDDISNILLQVHNRADSYGFHTKYFKNLRHENILVEFSSPNIAKLFHIGHYRSTVVGNVLSNILVAAGHDVIKMNYLGDWGIQFALLAVAFQKYGNENELKNKPLQHLFELYVKISAESEKYPVIMEDAQKVFLEMENGSADALQFWQKCRDLSIEEYKKLYNQIGIEFDVFSGEAQYCIQSKVILETLREKNFLIKSDGAIRVDLSDSPWLEQTEKYHSHPVVARSNGTTLYLSRDVAAAIDRYEKYKFDRMIYVTDHSQASHFKQLFGILDKMGYPWANKDSEQLVHKTFGRVQKMQTRKGNIVFLTDILEEAYQRTYESRQNCHTRKADLRNDEITKRLALSGLIYCDLKAHLKKGYKFSWDSVLTSKGSSGMYLQYTYSRLYSLELYSGADVTTSVDPNRITSQPSLVALLHHIVEYTHVTQKVYETLEPSFLVSYLFKLCQLASNCFATCIVKGQEEEDAKARLICFHCARLVLGNGLRLMGITPLEQH